MNIDPEAKRILCYGDSITFGRVPGEVKRFSVEERWTGVLQKLLGESYEIIEEGLRGRTTNINDPELKGRNGLDYFFGCVLSLLPLDLIIIFLGTNDLKEQFNRTPQQSAEVFKEYKASIKEACDYLQEGLPKILLISPPLIKGDTAAEEFAVSYKEVASEIGAEFLDSAKSVTASDSDGTHLDKENNEKLAEQLAVKIEVIFK